jgi:glycosyltransferase involved in cell wall biosynthesis
MRIALLNWRDIQHPHAGGAEVVVDEQAKRLVRRGHDVTLLTARYPHSQTEGSINGYRVVRRGDRFSVYPKVARYLRAERHRDRFDVVYEHATGIPWFAPVWSPVPSSAYFYHVIGPTFFQELPPPLALVGLGAERLGPAIYRHRRISCLGPGTRAGFRRIGYADSDLLTIPPGVNHDLYRPSGEKAPEPTLVLVGRVKRYKRLDVAIHALARLRRRHPTARLEVVGPDPDVLWPRLAELARSLGISEAVQYFGAVSEADKIERFRRAWVNLVSSDQEGWGLTVIEAAACGTPTVGTDIEGLDDTLVEGMTGLRFRHGDPGHLAERLDELLAAPDRRASLGTSAAAFARQFDWELHVTAVEGLLRSIQDEPLPVPAPYLTPGEKPTAGP